MFCVKHDGFEMDVDEKRVMTHWCFAVFERNLVYGLNV